MRKNMKIYIPLVILIIGTLFFTSCSSDEESATTAAAAAGAAISTFNGTFNGTCAGANEKTDIVVISDTTAAETTMVYSDSECTTKSHANTLNYTVVSTTTATVDAKSVTKIEGTTTTSLSTIYTDSRVTNANEGSWCGISDWVKNTAKDVTGLTCSNLNETYGSAGVKKYDIWYLSGSTFMHSGFNSDGYSTSLDYSKTKE